MEGEGEWRENGGRMMENGRVKKMCTVFLWIKWIMDNKIDKKIDKTCAYGGRKYSVRKKQELHINAVFRDMKRAIHSDFLYVFEVLCGLTHVVYESDELL